MDHNTNTIPEKTTMPVGVLTSPSDAEIKLATSFFFEIVMKLTGRRTFTAFGSGIPKAEKDFWLQSTKQISDQILEESKGNLYRDSGNSCIDSIQAAAQELDNLTHDKFGQTSLSGIPESVWATGILAIATYFSIRIELTDYENQQQNTEGSV